MNLDLYQVDAFADRVFAGNPAAVVPLDQWLPDETMQQIAEENNLSETAFFVGGGAHYHIRWFTPTHEVDLCGHATLATAHVIQHHLKLAQAQLSFKSRRGMLQVRCLGGSRYELDFPADPPKPHPALQEQMANALEARVQDALLATDDCVAVVASEAIVRRITPDFRIIEQLGTRGLLVTAPGDDSDFVSRCFFPSFGINEDPVTGSAHTVLTPYWAQRLGQDHLSARQLSRRGGALQCEWMQDRVKIAGDAITYLTGTIHL